MASGLVYSQELEFIKNLPNDGRILTYGLFNNAVDFGGNYLTKKYFSRDEKDRVGEVPVEYSFNSRGSPVVEGCLAFLDCDVVAIHEHGDHTIFVGEVEAVHTEGGHPLLYYRGRYSRLGNPIGAALPAPIDMEENR